MTKEARQAILECLDELQRYDFESAYDGPSCYGDMVESVDGVYLEYEDVRKLLLKLSEILL